MFIQQSSPRPFILYFLTLLFCSLFSYVRASHEVPNEFATLAGARVALQPSNRTNHSATPAVPDRCALIQTVLHEHHKSADADLIEEIGILTEGYTTDAIRGVVGRMACTTQGQCLDAYECLQIQQGVIQQYDQDLTVRGRKLERIANLIRRLRQTGSGVVDEEEYKEEGRDLPESENQEHRYPMLANLYHPDEMVNRYFRTAAEQLRTGHLTSELFRRGALLHGPPGVGKTQMVQALVNESSCTIFRESGSGLVNQFQGSGSATIRMLFESAKRVQRRSGPGCLIFIDELQSLVPRSQSRGEDLINALTQLWTELDACGAEHDHILVITACNEFDRIPETVAGRFKCIPFTMPDHETMGKILQDKALHFVLPQENVMAYHSKMKGWSGRRVTNVLQDAKGYMEMDVPLNEALEQAFQDQARGIAEAKRAARWKMIKEYSWTGAKCVGTGVAMAAGGTIIYSMLPAVAIKLGWLTAPQTVTAAQNVARAIAALAAAKKARERREAGTTS